MGRDIPLGRLAGIRVTMDLTVLLIAGVYTIALAENRFPIEAPDVGTPAHWIAGAGFALLFFASLLVHEIGHALVAQDEGIGVRSISLWLLGGVAKLESAPASARSEFRIAVVGPLASAACGVAFLAAAYVLPGAGLAGLAGNVFALLGRLNLVLAAFNLLPVAPLDGGTVLSSLVWRRTGRQGTGMRVAAYAGIGAGVLLVLYGARTVGSSGFGGWWLVIVGGYIAYAAARTLRTVPLYDLLQGAEVHEAMHPNPPMVAEIGTVADALRSLPVGTTHQAYPVVGPHGRVVGLLTAAAIRAVPPERWSSLRVADLAYPLDRLTTVRADEPLLPAAQKIDGGDVRDGLVVGADGTVVGTLDAGALYRTVEQRQRRTLGFSS